MSDDLEALAAGTGADARQARRTLTRRKASAARGGGEDFGLLEQELDDYAARIGPEGRRTLAGAVATDLRAANATRIRANVEPEGDPMAPRKRREGGKLRTKRLRDPLTGKRRKTRQDRMFTRAATPRFLRKTSTTGEATVGFVGAMARIMRVHHYGLEDTVTRDPASPRVPYPARPVIGITADDRLRILDLVEAQASP